jgi:hypothetical protein
VLQIFGRLLHIMAARARSRDEVSSQAAIDLGDDSAEGPSEGLLQASDLTSAQADAIGAGLQAGQQEVMDDVALLGSIEDEEEPAAATAAVNMVDCESLREQLTGSLLGILVACAYPERIAQRQSRGNRWQPVACQSQAHCILPLSVAASICSKFRWAGSCNLAESKEQIHACC